MTSDNITAVTLHTPLYAEQYPNNWLPGQINEKMHLRWIYGKQLQNHLVK